MRGRPQTKTSMAVFTMRLCLCELVLGLAGLLVQPSAAHVLPRETRTAEPALRQLNVLPWPLAATPAPRSPVNIEERRGRRLNTVCGYIGGNPDLPATCAAGSHCAVDVKHKAIGCCPDGAGCVSGIFTNCVDFNSEPQTVADPYVYTCEARNVCYKNTFDGGYYQYGCGTASDLATRVALTAAGKKPLALTQMSIALTATPTLLSEPTKISSHPHTDKTVLAETTTSNTDVASSTEPAAPSSGGGTKYLGPIIGASIGGVFALILLVAVFALIVRRRKGNARRGPGQNQNTKYISPMSENHHDFVPLSSSSNEGHAPQRTQLDGPREEPRDVPPAGPEEVTQNMPNAIPSTSGVVIDANRNANRTGAEPFRPNYPYGYGPGSTAGGIVVVRDGPPVEPDRAPLTTEITDFSEGFNTAVEEIQDDDDDRPYANADGMGQYPARRRDGDAPLWQQNRRRSRNMMWM